MNHRLIIEEIAVNCFCAKKDLPDLIIHELRHMGLSSSDYSECIKEMNSYMESI